MLLYRGVRHLGTLESMYYIKMFRNSSHEQLIHFTRILIEKVNGFSKLSIYILFKKSLSIYFLELVRVIYY